MEPEKTRQPLPTKKTTCQPTNQSKPANSCETPTPDDSETSTVNPVCQPTNPYENTNSNPGRHCPPPPKYPYPQRKQDKRAPEPFRWTEDQAPRSPCKTCRTRPTNIEAIQPDTRHETSHAIPIPHHLHQIGNADIEKYQPPEDGKGRRRSGDMANPFQ